MEHTLNIEDFKNTQSNNIIASASRINKRLVEVAQIDEHLRTTLFYRVEYGGKIVLDNATVIAAVEKYNSIQK